MTTDSENGTAGDGASGGARSTLSKVILPLLVPVVIAILVTAFTPVGERLRNALFPTATTVRGSVKLQGKPLPRADLSLDGRRQAPTDASGAFALSKVKQGEHVLTIEGIGVRARRVSFDVKRGAEGTDLGALDVEPSIRIAGEGSGGLDPPTDAMARTFRISYDVTIWLEGDADVLGRVAKVTYGFATRLQPGPVVVPTAANRFCHRIAGSVNLRIGESVEGPVVAAVTFKDGKTLELSVPGDQKLPAGQRPAGCPTPR